MTETPAGMWDHLRPEDRASQVVKGYEGARLDDPAKLAAIRADIATAIRDAADADRRAASRGQSERAERMQFVLEEIDHILSNTAPDIKDDEVAAWVRAALDGTPGPGEYRDQKLECGTKSDQESECASDHESE